MGFNNLKIIASKIEHTLLKPDANERDIEKLCNEGINFKFYGICIQPYWVKFSKGIVKEKIKVITVCGFPDGLNLTDIKLKEAIISIENGADEIDMVVNLGAFKSGDYKYVSEEIKMIKEGIGKKILKVIIETPLLNNEEIKRLSKIVEESGADFVKTGTGRNGSVKIDDIEVIKNSCSLPIKAAGGIRTKEFAFELISRGVSRIGTSSGVQILNS
jgi:deoxyribose-phosphate aldolase